MSIAVLIIGSSGTGKSTSLRNFNPNDVFLIQPIKKVLPFESARNWAVYDKEKRTGSIIKTDDPSTIIKVLKGSTRNIIVIDDYQDVVLNGYMSRARESGYQKFADIGLDTWHIMNAALDLPDNKRVYIMWHPDVDSLGNISVKTCGKMVEEKVNPASKVSICLMTHVDIDRPMEERYQFVTQKTGLDPAKSPMGMFPLYIPNDLKAVDDRLVEYFGV